MDHVWIIESRTPDMPRGNWRWFAICETEDIAREWWSPNINAKHHWYRQQGRLYCKTTYEGGEPVTFRISRINFYSANWHGLRKAS